MGQSRRGAMGVLRPLVMVIPKFIQISLPLPPLKPMAQSRRGVFQVAVHPLMVAIPRFIQPLTPLPLLKPMDQSRRGVAVLEVQVRPLIVAIPRFIQLSMPLLPLKPMAQSRRGVTHALEALHLHLSLHPIKYRSVLT
jgi:Tfp pilus assembly ATPase PilU